MLTAALSTSKKINANGVTISYEDSGISGSETTPLIFIHGFPFDKSCWDNQFSFFKHVTRVITYDIRGFGESGNSSEKPTIELFADDLVEFMNELKIDKAIICGMSIGGYISLQAIEKHAGRFEALILCDTQCGADSIEASDKRHFAIQQIEAGGIKEFADAQIKKVFSDHTQKETVEKFRNMIISTSPKILTGTLSALLQRKDACKNLGNIKVPVLIICGKEDSITPPALSEYMKKNIQDADLCIIEKAGHLSNLEQPEEFNKCLRKFLSKVLK